MKKYICLALTASAALALTSCNDFLDKNREPKTELPNTAAAWSSPEVVQLEVDKWIDEFSQAYGSGGGQDGWFYYKTLNDDQVGANFANWTFPTLVGSSGEWDYSMVRGANYIINNVATSDLSPENKTNFTAIGRLIRGYAYYQLVRKYGDVVWETEVLTPESPELYEGRDKRDDVMDLVLEDIDFAIANIATNASQTAWSKDYARAIKSEVCLYEGTFCRYRTLADNGLEPDEARAKRYLELSAAVSDELLGSYGFCDDYHSIYNSLWVGEVSSVDDKVTITGLSQNPELIFGRRYDAVNGRHSTISFTASSTTTSGMSLDAFKSFLFLNGKTTGDTPEDNSLEGVNETYPDPSKEDPNKIGHRYNIQKLLDVRDKRLSIITDPYVYYKGMEWSRAGSSGMNSSSGFGIAKYDNVYLPRTARTNSAQNYTSCPIYWTSYIALNYAEAKAELGQFGDAEFNKSLKKLYERAGLDMLNSVAALQAINDPANTRGIDGLLYEIRRCRRCELMFDNWIRYWDLVRWHELDRLDSEKNPDILRGAYVGNADVKPASVDAEGFVRPYSSTNRKYEAKYYLYPIPTGQIDLNPNLKQNPGW